MAVDPKPVDLHIRAILDQGLAPLDQVIPKIEAISRALLDQSRNQDAATKTEKDYVAELKQLTAELQTLQKVRGELARATKLQAEADEAAAKVTSQERRIAGQTRFFGANPSAGQQAFLDKMQATLTNAEGAAGRLNARLEQEITLLQRIGVVSQDADRDAARRQIAGADDRAGQALQAGLRDLERAKAEQQAFVRAQAQAQAEAASAQNAAQRLALSGRAAPPPTTLAGNVRDTLAGPPGPGAGTVLNLQSEIERINQVFATGGSEAKVYAQALRDLDKAFAEIDRQARAVTAFQERQRAVDASRAAFHAATDEVEHLRAALAATDDPRDIAAIQGKIATLQRSIGTSDTSGLAARFARDREAIEETRVTLHALGADVNSLGEAYVTLQNTATRAAEARTAAEKRAQAEVLRAIETTKQQASVLAQGFSVPKTAVAPTLVETVSKIQPGRNVPAEINDVSGAIDKLNGLIGKSKLTAESYNQAMAELFRIQHQIVSDASLVDQFRQQDAATKAAAQSFLAATQALRDLEIEARKGGASLAQVQQAERNLGNAATNVDRERQALANLNAQLQRRGIDTTQLDAATQHLTQTMTRLAQVQQGLEQSGGKVFGLGLYQVQNLGFQINDVITQLSLGQGVLRTIASQGGQIFQIFDLSIDAMKKLVVAGLPAAAVIGTLIASFERLQQTEAAQRTFAGQLAASTNTANTTARALVGLQREIERTGIGFADAGKAITLFANEGLNTDQIERFSRAAADLARGLGRDIGDAAKSLAEIPQAASAEKLFDILRGFQALTPEIVKYVQAQIDLGNISAAQDAVFAAATARGKAAKDVAISPLTEAVVGLTNAWHGFLDTIGPADTFVAIINSTKEFIQSVTAFSQAFSGGAADVGTFTSAAADLTSRLNQVFIPSVGLSSRTLLQLLGILDRKPPNLLDAVKTKIVDVQKELDEAKKRQDAFAANPSTPAGWIKLQSDFVDELKRKLEELIRLRDRYNENGALLPSATTPTGTPTTSTAVPGGEPLSQQQAATMDQLVEGFKKGGLEVNAAIAFAANAIRESGGNFKSVGDPQVQGGTFGGTTVPGGSHGLFQINRERLADFVRQNNGLLPEQTSVEAQIQFVLSELRGTKANVLEGLKALSAAEGAKFVTAKYEIPKDIPGQSAISARIADQYVARGSSASIDPNSPASQAQSEITRRKIQDEIDKQRADVNSILARGFSRQAQDVDAAYAKQVDRESIIKFTAENRGIQLTGAAEQARQEFVIGEIQKRAAQRQREDQEDRTQLENGIAAANKLVDAYEAAHGKLDAAQRVAFERFVAPINAVQNAIAKGATVDGQDPTATLTKLFAEREEAIKNARVDAAKVGFDEAEATLNNLAQGAQEAFRNGSITMAEMFTRIAAAVKDNAPKIKDAQTVALEQLAAAPNTPKNIATRAQIAGADVLGRKVTEAADAAAADTIAKQVAARDAAIKNAQDLASRGVISQRESESQIQDIYKQTRPLILANVDALQQEIVAQLALQKIQPDVALKQIAALRKIATETGNVTKEQQELDRGFEQSVSGHAIEALDAIGQAIGGVISGQLTWSQAITATGKAFAQMALSIISDIAKIIIKQEALAAIQSAGGFTGIVKGILGILGAAAGDYGSVAGAAGAGASAGGNFNINSAHSGLRIGDVSTRQRTVSLPSSFTMGYYHSGGRVAGLRPGEQIALVEEGEVVLTKQQQKQQDRTAAAMKSAAGSVSVTPIVAFSEDQVAEAVLNAPSGSKVFVTQAKRNAATLRQLVR